MSELKMSPSTRTRRRIACSTGIATADAVLSCRSRAHLANWVKQTAASWSVEGCGRGGARSVTFATGKPDTCKTLGLLGSTSNYRLLDESISTPSQRSGSHPSHFSKDQSGAQDGRSRSLRKAFPASPKQSVRPSSFSISIAVFT